MRLLLLADTHLGLSGGPASAGRRAKAGPPQADEFFANFERALQPAFRGEVDLVVHGGDVFFRSQVKPGLVFQAFEPLKRLADRGVPVVVVPGNHERSAIPYPLLAAHPGIHIFDRPRTFVLNIRGTAVAIAGFPNDRDHVRSRFASLLDQTSWRVPAAAIRLLCLHQSIEGATVGPVDYVFRDAPDVIEGAAIPRGVAAVLSGHIHRAQVFCRDLRGVRLGAPVFYPGSTTRTSTAERFEAKGFMTIQITPDANTGGRVSEWAFHQLDGVMNFREVRSAPGRVRGYAGPNPV